MIRKIIKIDSEKCNGCRLCVEACHEGAIGIVEGKARLLRDDYCDGLGHCLPVCPTGAIRFEEREALAYNEAEVRQNMERSDLPCGCPGTLEQSFSRSQEACAESEQNLPETFTQLNQWPVQLKLVPISASYFENAHLLVAADCAAYAYGHFHHQFMKDKITLIGCPKLDEGDYSKKLTAILAENQIQSVTVVRMEVPCCAGIENAVKSALKNTGKIIPCQVVTLSTDGKVLA